MILASTVIISQCAKENTDLLASAAPVAVFAHRGGAAIKPENSLVAFQFAISQLGVTAIELDVRQTADRKLVINHDTTINPNICLTPSGHPITNPPTIYKMTLAQIQKFDCGTLVGLSSNTHLPSLQQALTYVETLKSPMEALPNYILHVKWEENTVDPTEYVSLLAAALAPYNLGDRLYFMNDAPTILSLAGQVTPNLNLIYLNSPSVEAAVNLNVKAVAIGGSGITPDLINTYHQAGLLVFAFTIDQSYQWVSLTNDGIDGIVTNNPVDLVELLGGSKAIQSPRDR